VKGGVSKTWRNGGRGDRQSAGEISGISENNIERKLKSNIMKYQ
jgi:hypothetical protein